MVLPNLLNIRCLLSFVNSHPRITSTGSKKALPKLCTTTLLISAGLSPAMFVVLIFIAILPSDCPVVDSKYIQYAKNTRLVTVHPIEPAGLLNHRSGNPLASQNGKDITAKIAQRTIFT